MEVEKGEHLLKYQTTENVQSIPIKEIQPFHNRAQRYSEDRNSERSAKGKQGDRFSESGREPLSVQGRRNGCKG